MPEMSVDTTQAQDYLAQAMLYARLVIEPTAEGRAKLSAASTRMSIDDMLQEIASNARKAADEIDRLRIAHWG